MDSFNCIILAAGRSNSTAPYSFEVPKALFKVQGESLIERMIKQLKEAGVENIFVVIGYMKEKFLYLEEKFDVHLIIAKDFDAKNNVWSLYLSRKHLSSTYVCYCDCYYKNNPFLNDPLRAKGVPYHAMLDFNNSKLGVYLDSNQNIVRIERNASSCDGCLTGYAYFTRAYSQTFLKYLNYHIDQFGIDRKFYEEIIPDIPLRMGIRLFKKDDLIEFNTLDDLQKFDDQFLDSVDTNIFKNISHALNCRVSDIHSIKAISGGLTNVSFRFTVDGEDYVYRHPGASSNNFINRASEEIAQKVAYQMGLDKTFIAMNANEGWKISRFMKKSHPLSYQDKDGLLEVLSMLRRLHDSGNTSPYDVNTFYEAERWLSIARQKNSTLLQEMESLYSDIKKLYYYTELDSWGKSLCHIDSYNLNFLKNHETINIIDWEFARFCDPMNDLASIVSRYPFTEDETEFLIVSYFGKGLTTLKRRHTLAYFAISGWYWFCWCLCRDSLSEDIGFFYLDSYRTAKKYSKLALEEYQRIRV